MNHPKPISYFLFVYLILYSCSNKKEIHKGSEILNDIFIELVSDDLIYPIYPPPPPPQLVGPLGEVYTDSISEKKYNAIISKIKTNKNVFSFEDSTSLSLNPTNLIEILKDEDLYENYKSILKDLRKNNGKEIPIELNSINNTGKYELISRSKILPKNFDFRTFTEPFWSFNYYGNLKISKPLLNSSGNIGFLLFYKECGFECDRYYLVVIQKENSKWVISKKIWI